MLRRAVLPVVGAAISVAAIVLLVQIVDPSNALQTLGRAAPQPILLALLPISAQVAVRTLRWRTLLPRPRDGHRLRLARLAPVLLVGYLGNLLLPARLGEAVRSYLAASREHLPLAPTLGTAVLERVIDVATLAALALPAAILLEAPGWVVQATGLAASVAFGVMALLLVVGVTPAVGALRRLLRRLSVEPALQRSLDLLSAFGTGLQGRGRVRTVGLAAGLSVAAWLLETSIWWLVAQALGVNLSPAGALVVAGVTVLGTAVPSAPGYVGTFELAASAVLIGLGVAGAPALALAILVHGVTVLPIGLAGAVSLAGMGLSLSRIWALSGSDASNDAAERARCARSP